MRMNANAPIALRDTRPGNRAVLYLRQSKEREDSESIEIQEHIGREYCKQHGYSVVAVHLDRTTGQKWDSRPGVVATMDMIERSEADVIVLWKWSRLSRSRLHWAVASDRVDIAGGRIESATEPLDTTTASGRFARGLLTEVAAFQAEQIGEVWRETFDRRIREGLPATGRARFGYTRQDDGTYALNPAEAPDIAELYRRAIDGVGAARLARWANERGHRTTRGGLWLPHGLRGYLDHGFAAGLIYHGGKFHPGKHPAIITAENWEAYRGLRKLAPRRPRGKLGMVSGLAWCHCGARMMASSIRSDGSGSYGCARRQRGDSSCPAPVYITRARLEQYVSEWIEGLTPRVDLIREELAAVRRENPIEDREAIGRLIGKHEQRLTALTLRLIDGKISQTAYDGATSQVEQQIAELRARLQLAEPRRQDDLVDRIPELTEKWRDTPPEAQNRIAHALIAKVTVSPPFYGGDWRRRLTLTPNWDINHD